MNHSELAIFALNASRSFGETVSGHLGIPLEPHEERDYEDGEHKVRPLVSVRGKDVFIIQSMYQDSEQSVHDKLCRCLFFIGALKDASAGRVTAVIPYLCYGRKDRKVKPRDPVTTRYIAGLFEAVGLDHAITLDVHNPAAFQNAWRIATDHLEAKRLFVDYFAGLMKRKEVVVVSPDAGGMKRAEEFRRTLRGILQTPVHSALMEKYRNDQIIAGDTLSGDVAGKTVIILDDLISTGTTILRAAEACRKNGATTVYAAASHGLFSSKANETLSNSALEKVVVTSTVPPLRLDSNLVQEKLVVLDAASLFAEAIKRMHSGESIVDLLA
ncbi:MAG TPA: ribose-phosphate pyrophosphokinase [Terriglobia bacterium]|nr:ribose-phosphate pyrophosphokinase [Terriglobia bacterium]